MEEGYWGINNMRRVFHKLFFIWDLDKEEAWINNMAEHGYSLVKAGRFTFEFDETDSEKYKYKTLFLRGTAYSAKNTDFYKFIEEMGIEVVCTLNYPGTCCVYTRANAEEYPDGIEYYSDKDSKISYLRTSLGYNIFVEILMAFTACLSFYVGTKSNNALWLVNLGEGVLFFILLCLSTVAIIKTIMKISKLKKERAINE